MSSGSSKDRACPQFAAAAYVALGLTVGAGALAAESDNKSNDSDVLGEVTVTAQFREQSVQQTPLAITAISADMLESRNQTNIAEITSQAPNVTLKPQGAAFGPSLGASIRGVGQYDFNPALEPGVGIYVDDVYYATLTGSVMDLLDLERVEILRGPQGTLAGKNSIGGAVKLFSKKPQGKGGYLSGTYGSRDRTDIRGSADFAMSENVFARISGVSKQQRGYIERRDYGCDHPNSGVPVLAPVGHGCVLGYNGDVSYSAIRGQLRWVASDNLEINSAIDYTNDDRDAAGAVLVQATSTVNPNVQPAPGVNLPGSAFVVPWGSYYNYSSYYNPAGTFTKLTNPGAGTTTPMDETRADGRARFKGWGASTSIDWTLSDTMSVKSISAYRAYDSSFSNDNDLSPLAGSLGFGDLSFHSFSQELRLNGALLADKRLEYTLGAFYMDQKSLYSTTQDLRYSAASLTQFVGNDPVNADTVALFGHVSYALTDQLTLNGGIRHTDEHKDYTFSRKTRTGAPHPTLTALDGLVAPPYDGKKFDWRANAQYQWTSSVMTYLQFATGFKGGGISPRPFSAAQAVPFNPEQLKSYELGVKSDLFQRRARVNASVFFSDYTDVQLTLNTCPQYGVGLPCAVVANAGNARVKGAELETVLMPVDHLSIDASYSYLDFEYTHINPQVTSVKLGMRPAYVPKTKWSVGVQYEISLGTLGSLTPRLDASYQGQLFTNAANGPTNSIESYTLANARLTWRNGDDSWESALEVTNLTDKYYFLTRFDQYALAGTTDGQPGRPREWALTVKRKF